MAGGKTSHQPRRNRMRWSRRISAIYTLDQHPRHFAHARNHHVRPGGPERLGLGRPIRIANHPHSGGTRSIDVRKRVAGQNAPARLLTDGTRGLQDRFWIGFHACRVGVRSTDHRRYVCGEPVRRQVGTYRTGRVIADHRYRHSGLPNRRNDLTAIQRCFGSLDGPALGRAERVLYRPRYVLVAGRARTTEHL